MDETGRTLSKRPFQSSRLMTARAAVQVDHMMRVGAKVGTGRAFGSRYAEVMASKTGTTDDGRDAWFVGADGRRLGVAWVGFDDNRKAGLVGSVAALPVITDAFSVRPEKQTDPAHCRMDCATVGSINRDKLSISRVKVPKSVRYR